MSLHLPRRLPSTALSLLLLVALVGFTTIYRNSEFYSFSNPARCHSISSEARVSHDIVDHQALLAEVVVADVPPLPAQRPSHDNADPLPVRRVALTVSPLRRPPPVPA
jgi:hypothetical protein